MHPPHSDHHGGWRSAAACTGADPRLFTDPRSGTDDTDRAIATCRRCRVRQPCLAEALHQPDDDVGIWGATTGGDRHILRPSAGNTAQRQPTGEISPTQHRRNEALSRQHV
jgi:hypothetical protein